MRRADADPKPFLEVLQQALGNINELRSFKDERSFQGALLQELARRFPRGVNQDDPIIEEEYQKRMRAHGIRIRPDIIIHVPFDRGSMERRNQGNFIAIELKRRASAKTAAKAFANLEQLKARLNYPLTIFINVDSGKTRHELCPESIAAQTVCVAVELRDGNTLVHISGPER